MDGQSNTFIPLRDTQGKGKTWDNGSSYIADHRRSDKVITQEEENVRLQHGIEVEGIDCLPPIKTFEEANFAHPLMDFLKQRGVNKPTPIQMQSIPCLLKERDVIGISPTGSGKTLAYLLPLASRLNDVNGKGPHGLIIVPTRELVQQIAAIARELLQCLMKWQPGMEFYLPNTSQPALVYSDASGGDKPPHYPVVCAMPEPTPFFPAFSMPVGSPSPTPVYSSYSGNQNSTSASADIMSRSSTRLTVVEVCGGISTTQQINMLKNTDSSIIVATPGRLIDLTEKGVISYANACYVVLDECDKMLEMGMESQLRMVVSHVTVMPGKHQFSLWSATLPDALERLGRSAVVDPITIYVGVRDFVNTNITQKVLFLHTYQKPETLLKVLRKIPYPPVIIFASTKETVDRVVDLLEEEQFHVCGLHSDKDQEYRFKVMSAFRNGHVDVLVATDLASRGLDVPDVTHVINYDMPDVIEDYIHRCGRTGRFGRGGMATSFLTLSCKIAAELKQLLEEAKMPIPKHLEDVKQFGGKVVITEFGDRPI